MDKKSLTETDIRSKFITPAIVAPGKWDLESQLLEEHYNGPASTAALRQKIQVTTSASSTSPASRSINALPKRKR